MDKESKERFEYDFAICPWCDHRHNDTWEMEDGEHECNECGKTFLLESTTTRECTTKRIE